MFNKKKKNNKGFTLVELLVVIAIIGILAVVAVPSLFKNVNKAHAADAVSYISSFKTAAISEYTSTSTVPTATTVEGLVEGKPEKAIDTSVAITIDSSDNKTLKATFTMKKADIAKLVKDQLGDGSSVVGKAVTVDLIKLDVTE